MASYINPTLKLEDETEPTFIQSRDESGVDYKYEKKVFFAFIDVLGFKKSFDDHKGDPFNEGESSTEFADKYKDVFNYYFELMNASKLISTNDKGQCYAGQTSDSLYFYTSREDYLIQYIKLFLHFNMYAMSKDVFFRGGIAKGNLFIKKPYQFYGESVIYSCLLENDISKFPIIMIDEDTYKAIEGYAETEFLVNNDKNDRHFLNVFAPLHPEFSVSILDDMFNKREVKKEQVLDNIRKNRKIFEYDVKNYEKYGFLLNEYSKYEKGHENQAE